LIATLEPDRFITTLDLTASFVGPGRVVRRDGDIAFMEAELFDPYDNVVAIGLATARVIELDGPRS